LLVLPVNDLVDQLSPSYLLLALFNSLYIPRKIFNTFVIFPKGNTVALNFFYRFLWKHQLIQLEVLGASAVGLAHFYKVVEIFLRPASPTFR